MTNQTRAAIIRPKRTAIGKMAGQFAGIEAFDLQARAFHAVLGGLTPRLDETIVGNVTNSYGNIARIAATAAGIPANVPAYTIDRQCASSMEAAGVALAKITAGMGERFLIGGVESASQAPWLYKKTARPYNMTPPEPVPLRFACGMEDPPMGETAEILADEFSITREAMDEFAAMSHQRAAKAHGEGLLAEEVVAVSVPQRKGDPLEIAVDETVRPETTPEILARLRPVFRKEGRVTAGNSSPLNDGACAALVCSEAACDSDGVTPDAWLRDVVSVALEPRRMGMGPALAIPALLERNGLKQSDINLFEINEAFAAQILAVNSQLQIPLDVLNIHGGAIAIGHPLGCSGLRIIGTLVNAMKRTNAKRGVAALCVGGGQGMAALVEKV